MSADRLRQAATLLRERAEAAVNVTGAGDWHMAGMDDNGYHRVRSSGGYVLSDTTPDEAAYIATMAPPVALALADWLSVEAKDAEATERGVEYRAYMLADAILGDRA